ncbi:hypothetical protein JVU11DRAFT_9250 [Chiua virens]|nr:hypothetical protein JVU11DRAFT_9250 [Chiua virens]
MLFVKFILSFIWLIELLRSLIETEQRLHLYRGILKLMPNLRAKLEMVSRNGLKKIINEIAREMSDMCSADLSSVKHKGLKYFPQNKFSKSDALDPPIPEVSDKSMRGIFHPQLARFLCPARKLDQFDTGTEL